MELNAYEQNRHAERLRQVYAALSTPAFMRFPKSVKQKQQSEQDNGRMQLLRPDFPAEENSLGIDRVEQASDQRDAPAAAAPSDKPQ